MLSFINNIVFSSILESYVSLLVLISKHLGAYFFYSILWLDLFALLILFNGKNFSLNVFCAFIVSSLCHFGGG